jgi:hypothetical protein
MDGTEEDGLREMREALWDHQGLVYTTYYLDMKACNTTSRTSHIESLYAMKDMLSE